MSVITSQEREDDEDVCTHPHTFSDAWAIFKSEVVDRTSKKLTPGEVACVKYPYAAGFLEALRVFGHLANLSESPMAQMVLQLLLADATRACVKAADALPTSTASQEQPVQAPQATAPVNPNLH